MTLGIWQLILSTWFLVVASTGAGTTWARVFRKRRLKADEQKQTIDALSEYHGRLISSQSMDPSAGVLSDDLNDEAFETPEYQKIYDRS